MTVAIAVVCGTCDRLFHPDTSAGKHVGWFGVCPACAAHVVSTDMLAELADFDVHLTRSQQVEQVEG